MDPVSGSQEHDGLSNLLLTHLLSDRDWQRQPNAAPAIPLLRKALLCLHHLAHEKCSHPLPCTWNWF